MGRYDSSLDGPQMDTALEDMANHTSERYAKGTVQGTAVTSGDGYHDNSKYYKQQSEAWAVGQIDGVDVTSSDARYHNNAKYWSEQSEAASTHAPYINSTNMHWMVWSTSSGAYVDSGTAATGEDASVTATEYQASTSGTVTPTGTWQSTIPTVAGGSYLWTRFTWNDGTYSYITARQGVDGGGGGSGDMLKSTYDPDDTVATAGGIEDYVEGYAVAKNSDITGATKCKVTYDGKGLVTAGADLEASDIPSLTVSKLSDITATASELNTLDGITATTTELNYTDGVTSNIQTQLDAKATKPDMGTISLSGTWSGSASPYSQTVTVSGATVTANSKVDIQPDSTALAQMLSDGCNALYISNNNGTLTAYAVGSGTTTALTIQCSVTEVTQ